VNACLFAGVEDHVHIHCHFPVEALLNFSRNGIPDYCESLEGVLGTAIDPNSSFAGHKGSLCLSGVFALLEMNWKEVWGKRYKDFGTLDWCGTATPHHSDPGLCANIKNFIPLSDAALVVAY
jgi:hypothetical protein